MGRPYSSQYDCSWALSGLSNRGSSCTKVIEVPAWNFFSWADNSSTDPDKAIAFYQDLFGWGKYEIPIDENYHSYTMFHPSGRKRGRAERT